MAETNVLRVCDAMRATDGVEGHEKERKRSGEWRCGTARRQARGSRYPRSSKPTLKSTTRTHKRRTLSSRNISSERFLLSLGVDFEGGGGPALT
eukprot:962463-Rhodomonas_salina.1